MNLALVVGPPRADGKHEVVTVLQRLALSDRLVVEKSSEPGVHGFAADTLVTDALASVSGSAGVDMTLAATIRKRIPVAAGLGGGSSDAATALRLANEWLDRPLPQDWLVQMAARLGTDVPFFLHDGPQLGTGDGSELAPLDLPQDYWVLLVLPSGARKSSTAAVYSAFEQRGGAEGFDARRARLLAVLPRVRRARDLEKLPANDLASSPLAARLRELGAFRADVTGAGPAVYGLFLHEDRARAAERAFSRLGRTWITVPAWYR